MSCGHPEAYLWLMSSDDCMEHSSQLNQSCMCANQGASGSLLGIACAVLILCAALGSVRARQLSTCSSNCLWAAESSVGLWHYNDCSNSATCVVLSSQKTCSEQRPSAADCLCFCPGIQSNRVLRLSGIFLNLHFINKPEVSFSIGDPANFNRETGELISEQGIERVRQLIDSLAIWTRRLQQ